MKQDPEAGHSHRPTDICWTMVFSHDPVNICHSLYRFFTTFCHQRLHGLMSKRKAISIQVRSSFMACRLVFFWEITSRSKRQHSKHSIYHCLARPFVMTSFTTSPTFHSVPGTLFCGGTNAFFFGTPPLSGSDGALQSVVRQGANVNRNGDASVCLCESLSCTLSDDERLWMNFDRECSGAHMSARNPMFGEEPT